MKRRRSVTLHLEGRSRGVGKARGDVCISDPSEWLDLLSLIAEHVRERGTGALGARSHRVLVARGTNQSTLLCCAIAELADKLGVE